MYAVGDEANPALFAPTNMPFCGTPKANMVAIPESTHADIKMTLTPITEAASGARRHDEQGDGHGL